MAQSQESQTIKLVISTCHNFGNFASQFNAASFCFVFYTNVIVAYQLT